MVEQSGSDQRRAPLGDARLDRLGTERIPRLLVEFAIPSMIGLLVESLYNVADTIFVGWGVGATGIAATTAAFPAFLILIAVDMLIGQGGNALAALKLGEGDKEGAERILGTTFALLVVAGIGLFVLLAPLTTTLMSLSGASEEVLPQARIYFLIILGGFLVQSVGFGINNFIRTVGAPNRALLTMLLGAFVNIVLNYLFVLVWGWGVAGAAIATVIGEFASAVAVLQYFLAPTSPLRLHLRFIRLPLELAKRIIVLGFASFAMQASAAVVGLFFNHMLTRYGAGDPIGADGALAAWGVISKVSELFFVPALGFALATQPLIGYNYGAEKYARVQEAHHIAVMCTNLVLAVLWVVVELWPGAVVSLFTLDTTLAPFATQVLRIYMLLTPLYGIQVCAGVYFQAIGKSGKAAFIETSRQILFLIPLVLIASIVLPTFGISPLYALFWGVVASDVLSIVTASLLYRHDSRRLDTLVVAQQHAAGDASGL
jgi:putative MATE family efflux protein